MNFSSDAMADSEGLLEVNRKICKQQMAEKASPTLPTNCAVLPILWAGGHMGMMQRLASPAKSISSVSLAADSFLCGGSLWG